MKTVAIIPAKGFSKRTPHKNIREFNGTSLFMKSVNYAIQEGIMPLVASESEEILRIARREGVPVFKEAEKEDSELEVLINEILCEHERIESFCILQPTSPLRKKGLLKEMMKNVGEYGSFTIQKIKLVGLLGGKIYRNDLKTTEDKYFYFYDGNILCRNANDYRKRRVLLTEKMEAVEQEFPYNLQIDYENEFQVLRLIDEKREELNL